MSSEPAISKTSSPITALETSKRVNEGADPVSEESERGSEATNPADSAAGQAYEAADQTESLGAGAPPTTPLQILRTLTETGKASKSVTKTAVPETEKFENSVRRLWAPFVLQPAAILLFIGAFTISLIGIIILFIISNRQAGIASVNSNYYYLWTYGPTAEFVLIGAFWAQVQYRALEIMPWLLMSSSFTSASESVLLDYISPWSIKSLLKTLRKKHFFATLAINGTFLIKLATVFATGLFSTSLSKIATTTTFTKVTTFKNSYASDPGQIRNSDTTPLLSAYVNNQFNTSPPLGSNSNHAFEVFYDGSIANDSPSALNQSYQATVHVLTTDLSCEEATATAALVNQTTIGTVLTLRTQSCSISIRLDAAGVATAIISPLDQYATQFAVFGCTDETLYDGFNGCLVGQNISNDAVLWGYFTAPESDSSAASFELPIWTGSDNSTTVVNQRYAAIMCQPKVETSLGRVTINRDFSTGATLSEVAIQESSEIPALAMNSSSLSLPEALLYQAYCPLPFFMTGNIATSLTFANTTEADLPSLSNATIFAANVRASVGSIMAQAARIYLMVPSNDTVKGVVFSPDLRLVIQPVSFGMIIGVLCLAIVNCSILIIRYIPCRVCSRDPGSIGGLASILARSIAASQSFQGTDFLSTKDMDHLLEEKKYCTRIGDHGEFFIEQDNDKANHKIDQNSDIKWWTPFSLTIPSFLLTLLLPISLVVVMEVLLHVSTQSDGIANVDDQSYMRYAWKFLPALAVLGVQSLFESLSFSVRTLQPYHLLRKGKAPRWVVMENLQRKPAVWACVDSLSKRQWVVFFAVFPVLLAPFLPIAVSGLYAPINTLAVQPAVATVLDQFILMQSIPVDTFNITGTNSTVIKPYYDTSNNVDGGIAEYTGDMILVLNRSYPQWTYAKYAFSQIEFLEDGGFSTAGQNQHALSIILPAVYIDMNCSVLPAANYDLVRLNFGWALIYRNLGFENCQFGNTTATSPNVNTTSPAEYWALASSVLESPSFGNISTGCPTMMFAFGKMEGDAVSTNQASVLQCRPRIEAVDLNVTLSLPSLGVDLTNIPEPVKGSEQILFDASFGTDELGIVSVVPGLSDLYPVEESGGLTNVNSNFEPFFQTMIYGLNGTPPEELATNPEALIDGVQRIYGVITAQLINFGGRQNYVANNTAGKEPPVFSGQLLNLSQARLQQSAISTRILEALLLAMIASGIVTICFMSSARRLMPKGPYTIGAVWSLLASSKMLGEDVIPPGSEWCNDEKLKSRQVFEGKSFTLALREKREDNLQPRRSFRLDIENE